MTTWSRLLKKVLVKEVMDLVVTKLELHLQEITKVKGLHIPFEMMPNWIKVLELLFPWFDNSLNAVKYAKKILWINYDVIMVLALKTLWNHLQDLNFKVRVAATERKLRRLRYSMLNCHILFLINEWSDILNNIILNV